MYSSHMPNFLTKDGKLYSFESSNFDTLNQTTMLDGTYTFNKVQIQNTNKDENYTPVASDYVDTYSYKTFVEPEPLELLLNYNVSEEIFSFFAISLRL